MGYEQPLKPVTGGAAGDTRIYLTDLFQDLTMFQQETGNGGVIQKANSGLDLISNATAGGRARLRKDIENIDKARDPRYVTELIVSTAPTNGEAILCGIGYTAIAAAGFTYTTAGQACIKATWVSGVLTLRASSTGTNTEETTVITGVDVTQYHVYDVQVYTDRVEFYIDGVLKATHTAQVPQNLNDWDNFPNLGVANKNNANNVSLRVKYHAFGMKTGTT